MALSSITNGISKIGAAASNQLKTADATTLKGVKKLTQLGKQTDTTAISSEARGPDNGNSAGLLALTMALTQMASQDMMQQEAVGLQTNLPTRKEFPQMQ